MQHCWRYLWAISRRPCLATGEPSHWQPVKGTCAPVIAFRGAPDSQVLANSQLTMRLLSCSISSSMFGLMRHKGFDLPGAAGQLATRSLAKKFACSWCKTGHGSCVWSLVRFAGT